MLKVRDIMTTDVVAVSPGTTLRDAIELFARKHVSGAPVLDGAKVVGVVSASDILAFEATNPAAPADREDVEWSEPDEAEELGGDEVDAEGELTAEYFTEDWNDDGPGVDRRMAQLSAPDWDLLAEHDVDEIMTRRVFSVQPDAAVEEAARLMTSAGVHRVFVTDGKRIVGVVSAIDITHAVAGSQIGKHTYVFNPDNDFDNR